VAVRAVELAALMLLGLVVLRALVWGRAVETARGLSGGSATARCATASGCSGARSGR
jgi:hypothetical protein